MQEAWEKRVKTSSSYLKKQKQTKSYSRIFSFISVLNKKHSLCSIHHPYIYNGGQTGSYITLPYRVVIRITTSNVRNLFTIFLGSYSLQTGKNIQ